MPKRGTRGSKWTFKKRVRSATRVMIFAARLARKMEDKGQIQACEFQTYPIERIQISSNVLPSEQSSGRQHVRLPSVLREITYQPESVLKPKTKGLTNYATLRCEPVRSNNGGSRINTVLSNGEYRNTNPRNSVVYSG